jgi:D-glycero-alpha-D-manno-heptose-7-phosphate kinase
MSLITVKVPFRISIGGGGTDLPSYCNEFGGQLITASINKYIYIIINEPAIR